MLFYLQEVSPVPALCTRHHLYFFVVVANHIYSVTVCSKLRSYGERRGKEGREKEGKEQRFQPPVAANKAVYVAVGCHRNQGRQLDHPNVFQEEYSILVLLNIENSVASSGPRGGRMPWK